MNDNTAETLRGQPEIQALTRLNRRTHMYATVVKHNTKSNTVTRGEVIANLHNKVILAVIVKGGQKSIKTFKKDSCVITFEQ